MKAILIKILSVSVSCSLVLAEIPLVEVTEVCNLDSSTSFGYTGDSTGKRIYTKEEYVYKCEKTTIEKGECINTSDTRESFDFNKLNRPSVVWEKTDFQGSMGAVVASADAYDKLSNLWGGWHGICRYGADDGNWDWLSDPYVLAGYAMAGAGAYFQAAASSAQVASTAAGAASTTTTAAATAAETAAAVAQAAAETARLVKYAVCAAEAGINVAQMVEEYESDGVPCDPIDEFCNEDDGVGDEQIYTLPEQKYYDMIAASPEAVDQIQILDGVGTGVLKVKMVAPTQTDAVDMSAMEDEMQAMKELRLKLNGAMAAIQLAGCLFSNQGSSTSETGADGEEADVFSVKNVTTMTIGVIFPLAGIGVSVLFNVYDSLQTIDTCEDEDDAKAKGTRHISTMNAKKYDMCHFTHQEESGDSLTMDEKTIKYYCCYDNKITRILVEQVKAQFLQDWQHCTGITIAELQNVSFTSCDPQKIDNGIDGAKLDAFATHAQRVQAVQYQDKCIDTRGFMAAMMEKFGTDDMLVDESMFDSILNDMKIDQANN